MPAITARTLDANTGVKTLSISLSDRAFSELSTLAREHGSTVYQLFRIALGLLKIAMNAESAGRRIVITDSAGTPIEQIVISKRD